MTDRPGGGEELLPCPFGRHRKHEWGRGEYGAKCLWCEAMNERLLPPNLRTRALTKATDTESGR